MRITLGIISQDGASRKLWLGPGQAIVVGRTEIAEFVVADDVKMSGAHFSVAWAKGEFRIRDLNSTNGTKVNGTRIHETALSDGDLVVAGHTHFRVTLERDEPDEIPGGAGAGRATIAATPENRESEAAGPNRFDSIDVASAPDAQRPFAVPVPATPAPPIGWNAAVSPAPGGQADDSFGPELLVVDNATPFEVTAMPWDNGRGKCRLTVIIKATFTFNRNVQAADKQLPILFGDQHYDDDPLAPVMFESDMVPFKPRADVVLVGRAHAPGRRPVSELDVKLQVGALQKVIRVFGDRKWVFPSRLALIPQMTKPEAFVSMELTYRRSFGGIDEAAALYCEENLCGVGFAGQLSPKSLHEKPLPNLEDPDRLIQSWDSRPQPVGLGFYGRGWMPRLKFAGTMDEQYNRERAPQPPEDFSYEVYNGAHPDLQVDGYLRGDEQVRLENLAAATPLTFRLPGIRPLVSLTRNRAGVIQEEGPVLPPLDTLVLVPDERLFYAVYRIAVPLPDLDDIDVQRIRVES